MRSHRRRRGRSCGLISSCVSAASAGIVLLASHPLFATDRFWTNASGGTFNATANWGGNPVPVAADNAHFNLGTTGYTVTFTQANTNTKLLVQLDRPTFALGGFVYTLTGGASVGDAASDVAILTLQNGTIAVGGGTLLVGNLGTGTLVLGASSHLTSSAGPTVLGAGSLSSGTVQMSTSGASWGTASITIADQGSAQFLLSSASTFSASDGVVVGNAATGHGSISVSGGGTLAISAGSFTIGNAGSGVLNVVNGTVSTPGANLLGALAGGSRHGDDRGRRKLVHRGIGHHRRRRDRCREHLQRRNGLFRLRDPRWRKLADTRQRPASRSQARAARGRATESCASAPQAMAPSWYPAAAL